MSSKFGKNPRSQNLSFYCVDSCLKVLRNVKTSPPALLEPQIAFFRSRFVKLCYIRHFGAYRAFRRDEIAFFGSRFTKLCYIRYFGAYRAKGSSKKTFLLVPSSKNEKTS